MGEIPLKQHSLSCDRLVVIQVQLKSARKGNNQPKQGTQLHCYVMHCRHSTPHCHDPQAPHGSLGLLLMPQGRVTSMYPTAIEAQYIGMDTLVSLAPLTLGIIAKGNMTVAGG
jgi:hypothetical protein